MESTILGPVLFVVAVQWWLLQASNGDIGEIDRLKRQRNEERSGRILAQQKLRELRNKESNSKGFVLEPIAYLESPFLERRGTPRQPMLVPAAKARIRFVKQRIQHEHFAELKEFSHLWVVFMFHENTNVGTTIAARIKPPRLYGKRVGCLSSRSPHRPNPIGLSVCEILEVGADYIDIGCVDMMHGTPILDVKPYLPYDAIPLGEDCAGAKMVMSRSALRVPAWIAEEVETKPLYFTAESWSVLEALSDTKEFDFLDSLEDAVSFIHQVLVQDIRGHHQGRGCGLPIPVQTLLDRTVTAGGAPCVSMETLSSCLEQTQTNPKHVIYICRLDVMHLEFVTLEDAIVIVGIRSKE